MKKTILTLAAAFCAGVAEAQVSYDVMVVHKADGTTENYKVTDVDYVDYTTVSEWPTCPDDSHPHAIDLGLPSGRKWCCRNVGASSPADYGGYYSWGGTAAKTSYSTTDCSATTDIQKTDYDVAYNSSGGKWAMPTKADWEELKGQCGFSWVKADAADNPYHAAGLFVINKARTAGFFLPAAGNYSGSTLYSKDTVGHYWASTPNGSDTAYSFGGGSGSQDVESASRMYGCSVRPVACQ